MRNRYRRRRDTLVAALEGFDVGIGGLAAGVNMVLTLSDGTEHKVLRRAGEAGIALSGLASMRHPWAGPQVADPDGAIVGPVGRFQPNTSPANRNPVASTVPTSGPSHCGLASR